MSEVERKNTTISNLDIVEKSKVPNEIYAFDKETSKIKLHSDINDEYSLVALLDATDMQNAVSERYQVYCTQDGTLKIKLT